MNILIINHYAGSPLMGMEFRPYYFAKQWVALGHEVTILAADNSHLRKQKIIITKKIEEELIDGIRYVWVKTPEYSGNGLSRMRNMFSFAFRVWRNAKKFSIKYKPDVVIASSTYIADNYISKKISKITGAKYIFEVHDLWPLSLIEVGGMSKHNPFIAVMQRGENYAYKNCDFVVSLLPKTQEHMKEHGLDLTKWHYIPNGFVIEDWENPEDIPNELKQKIENYKKENKYIVGYAGTMGISNSLDTLVDAAHILADTKDIVFMFVGYGNEKENLKNRAAGLDNISFHDAIPKKAIPTLLKDMDVLCVGAVKSDLYRFGVSPNKMIDYMIAGKPIVQYIESGYDIIQLSKTGLSIETENPQALAKAILEVKQLNSEQLEQIKVNGLKFVMENHEYKILSKRYLDIMQS
jgi:glycosyltransferase involved in cell wall biosynthesis